MRLIDADELKKYAIPCKIHNGALTDMCVPLYQIDNALTVPQVTVFAENADEKTVEELKAELEQVINEARTQGEWINHRNDYGHNIADCSLCGKAMQWHDEDEDGSPRYCWYCGASMKGDIK